MKLYTICVNRRPVVTMSVGAEDPVPDEWLMDAKLIKAILDTADLVNSMPAEVQRIAELHEIDEALDTWLGADLQVLKDDEGAPLWTGDHKDLDIREARTDEAEQWHISRRSAIDTGEIDAGEESWLLFLVGAREPDCPDQEDDPRGLKPG